MTYTDRKTLFIFLDESGNLDFSLTGTKYWSLTAICTFHPCDGKEALLDLHYSLMDYGLEHEYFHAAEDNTHVRSRVFGLIQNMKSYHEVHCVVAEKRKAHPSLYRKTKLKAKGAKLVTIKDEAPFYRLVCQTLLKYVFGRHCLAHAERIIVVLSSIFNKERHETIRGALTVQLKNHARVPFTIHFQQNRSDMNCQLADYYGWAIASKWERGKDEFYSLVKSRVKSEFDLFARGTQRHY